MTVLYVTGDRIGSATGGGQVTYHESKALGRIGRTAVWSFSDTDRPWGADEQATLRLEQQPDIAPRLAHFYSGTFSKTIEILKSRGTVVTYTAAAHDIEISRQEHLKLGLPFDYPHLTDPDLWERYVRGYRLADLVICPSTLSEDCMVSYGCSRVAVIPHGVDLPPETRPLPEQFHVAYLGQPGPDKGLVYLLDAWKILDYKDAVLTIAGYGTEHLLPLIRACGGGLIHLRGAVDKVSEIYNACSVYIQPSASEGFGIEILEAMAHGRPVICSDGAGARDVVGDGTVVQKRNAQALVQAIHTCRLIGHDSLTKDGNENRRRAESYTWNKIEQQYVDLWKALVLT